MYPYLTFGSITLSLVGIGIVFSFLYFLWVIYGLSKKYRLNFYYFFSRLPLFLFCVYFFGKRGTLLIKDRVLFVHGWDNFLFFLHPHGVPFDYVGLVFGIVVFFVFFFSSKKILKNSGIWVYVLFRGMVSSLMILGFFLIFGDGFMGKATDSSFSIHPLTESATSLAKYDKVYPVGIIFSFAMFASFFFSSMLTFFSKRYHGRFGFSCMLFFMSFVFPYQNYPQYGVREFMGQRFDIKYYISRMLSLVCLFLFVRSYHKDPRITDDDALYRG